MISSLKFIDANVFIQRWSDPSAKQLINTLDREKHCTSALVLAEVHHKLSQKKVENLFEYIRGIMGAIMVYDVTKGDLFNAMKNDLAIPLSDKIHREVMRRENISIIISYDTDFDKDKTLVREEP